MTHDAPSPHPPQPPDHITTSAPSKTSPTLESLPYDLLHHIISYLPHATSLTSLSSTSHALHTFITSDGWRIFLSSQFPSLFPSLPPAAGYLETAKRLTLYARNHRKRTFTVAYLPALPPAAPSGGNRRTRHRRASVVAGTNQTLGYRPALASSEDVLLVGAGAELLIHRLESSPLPLPQSQRFGRAGHDDILSTLLLPGEGRALIGQANGALSEVSFQSQQHHERGHITITSTYPTASRSVRDLSLSPDGGLIAASLCGPSKDSTLRLYPLSSSTTSSSSPSSFTDLPHPPQTALWTSRFLSNNTVITATTSPAPIRIYDLTTANLTRTFPLTTPAPSRSPSPDPYSDAPNTCVFALAPLPNSPSLFTSGWYTGSVRLHDLRLSGEETVRIVDPLDAGNAVYSLLPLDDRKVLVGSQRHGIVKAYDLRMPTRGWGVYLPSLLARHAGGKSHPGGAGAVYTLAEVGLGGGRVFAGVEGGVVEVSFTGDEPLIPRESEWKVQHQKRRSYGGHGERKEQMVGADKGEGQEGWGMGLMMYGWEKGREVRLWRMDKGGRGGGEGLDRRWRRVGMERPSGRGGGHGHGGHGRGHTTTTTV